MKFMRRLAIVFLFAVIFVGPSLAETFTDNFDGKSQLNWTPIRGTWSIVDGKYCQTSFPGPNDAMSISGDCLWQDYTFEVKARRTSGGNEGIMVMFRVEDKDNFYVWVMGIHSPNLSFLQSVRTGMSISQSDVLDQKQFPIESNKWYNLKVSVKETKRGAEIKCYIDDKLIHSCVDDSIFSKSYHANGMIGLGTWHSKTEFAELKINVEKKAPSVYIRKVWPKKLAYKQNDVVSIDIGVKNFTDENKEEKLVCKIIKELDTEETILTEPLKLAPREEKLINVKWNAGKEEYGFEARAILVDKDGKITDEKGEYFGVGNPYKIGQSSGYGAAGTRNKKYIKEKLIPGCRRDYVPTLELGGWSWGGGVRMVPDADIYVGGFGGYHHSVSNIMMLISECHKQGITVLGYGWVAPGGPPGFEFVREHPEWAAYDSKGRFSAQFNVNILEQRAVSVDYPAGGQDCVNLDVYNPDVICHMADDLVKAIKFFGFDGIRWDGHPIIWIFTGAILDSIIGGSYYRYDGKSEPLISKKEDIDKISLRNMKIIKEAVKKEFPDFIWGYNWCYKHQDILYPEVYSETWKYCAKNALIWDELTNTRENKKLEWNKFMLRIVDGVDYVREAGGYYLGGAFLGGTGIYNRHLKSIVFACNSRSWGPGEYNDFAFRYSSLLYDNNLKRIKEGVDEMVQVEGKSPLWWKEFVYRKPSGKNKEYLIIHLVNPPLKPEMNYEEKEAPPVQENISVTIKLPEGRKLAKAFLLTPDSDKISAGLNAAETGSSIKVIIPRLEYWDMIVFELNKI